MVFSFLEAVEAFVNAILKAVQDLLNFLGINVTLDPIDIGSDE
ncbi:MAG: hypothetical protein N3G21_08285 [Candidatus Hydrogenedentes bacterium]|nr:hypothetical protein [Candidatus Hydrogenedentota bacterium]